MSESVTVAAKACSACGVVKPQDAFAKASWCADGRRNKCKECRRVATVVAIEKTCTACLEQKPVAAFQKRAGTPDGYHQLCRDCRSIERRAYYWRDPEKDLAAARAWRAANREKVLATVSRWQRANPERRRAYEGARRARLREGFVGKVDVTALWTGNCGICGDEIDAALVSPDPMSKSLDHIIPLSLGGSHEQSNLQWTHLHCNIRKGARPSI